MKITTAHAAAFRAQRLRHDVTRGRGCRPSTCLAACGAAVMTRATSARRPQRRRAQQAHGRCHHCPGWCSPKHPRRPSPKEDRRQGQVSATLTTRVPRLAPRTHQNQSVFFNTTKPTKKPKQPLCLLCLFSRCRVCLLSWVPPHQLTQTSF